MDKLNMRIAVLAFGALAVVPGMAAAGGVDELGDEPSQFTGANPGEMIGSFVWLMVALAIVIVLIILVIKWLSKRGRAWGVNRSMRSLGGVALGQNSSLQVVEIAGRIYVVGVGESISLIDKLDDPQQVADMLAALDRNDADAWPRLDVASLVGKWRKSKQEEEQRQDEAQHSSASFQQMLQSKLSGQADRRQQLEELLHNQKRNERLMDDEK